MENKDTIELNWKVILYILAIAMILLLVLVSFGIINLNFSGKTNGGAVGSSSENYANLPEKCRPTAGYDLDSWKEHLGHHAETQECLKYFK